MLRLLIDNKIPFIEGRLEGVADVEYVAPDGFTPERVAAADALIIRTRTHCDSRLLKDSKVSLVATATIGTDHIDLPWCHDNGITVRNAAGCNAPGVAQYVWSSLLRMGFDVRVSTLGVVGYGHIGSIVADWGRKMGCRVIVCDPPRQKSGLTDEDYLPLEEILRLSDAVTLHTPLTKSGDDPTFHMIGDRELEMLRPGAILINASRGGVVDNEAWAAHLLKGTTRAVVDVWENEPDLNRDLLRLAEIATPHIAGYSFEGKQRATRMAIEAVEEKFGISGDTAALTGNYTAPASISSPEDISGSYDPYADTAALRGNPLNFEKLRGSYDYRREPAFRS